MTTTRTDWETRFTVASYALTVVTLALFAAGLLWGPGWMVAALVSTGASIAAVTLSAIAGMLARGNKQIEQATKGIGGRS